MREFLRLSVFFLTFMVNFPVFADSYAVREDVVTSEERAIYAFFYAAGVFPDYEYWIKESDAYKSLPKDRKVRENYFIKESLRLGRGYSAYDWHSDVLKLTTNVVVKYHSPKDGHDPKITYRFFNLRNDGVPTFNFAFGSGTVSLVVSSLKAFSSLNLSEDEDKVVSQKVPYDDDEFDATLEFYVKPGKADYKNPIRQGRKYHWVMSGDVAYIRCVYRSNYSGQDVVLWEYIAPWYEEAYRLKNMPEDEKYPHPYDLFKD